LPGSAGKSNGVTRAATAELVARALRGRALACAESCTAGRISEALAGVTGAAEWFRGGVVAYQEPVKRALLDGEAASVLSQQAAVEMATGVGELLEAAVSVATTGVAGDEPVDGVAPGTVFIATYVGGDVRVATHRFDGDPIAVCETASDCALASLLEHLRAEGGRR
jgi:nicotinamide-nucleotide amidase